MDYEIVPVQTGKGQQFAAVRNKKQSNEGRNQGGRDFSDSDMTEILAIADNEQELHERVQKLSRKKLFGIF